MKPLTVEGEVANASFNKYTNSANQYCRYINSLLEVLNEVLVKLNEIKSDFAADGVIVTSETNDNDSRTDDILSYYVCSFNDDIIKIIERLIEVYPMKKNTIVNRANILQEMSVLQGNIETELSDEIK